MYDTQFRPHRTLSLLLLLLFTACFATTHSAKAASFTVACNDVTGLANAINSANGNGQADTINLTANCIYTFTSANNSTEGNNALPSINSEITLVGNGATLAVNNQNALTRVFHIAASGVLTIQNASLINGLGDGYAFLNRGTVALISSTVSNATNSQPGGRAINNSGTLLIDQSSITDNGNGGIITSGMLTVTRSFFQNNHAENGGAIFADSGAGVWIGNSTFANNSADTFSGALTTASSVTTDPIVSIFNSTFVGNSAFRAGALKRSRGSVTVRNSLFTNNSGVIGGCEGINSAGNNFSDESSCGTSSSNLRLSPLGSYGGATKTYLPGSGSVAISAGDATTCTNAPVNAVDQRNIARPQGVGCESGAVEANIIVSPALLGTVVQNNAYPSTLFDASGGSGGYTFILTGTLPAGVSFVNKTLSGTPTEAGNFPICVIATDNSGMAGASCDTLVVTIQPVLSIGDVSVLEGNAGSVSALFPVTLNVASATTITVNYASSNGSVPASAATAGSDYGSVSGSLTFAPGITSQTITVTVNGDATHEPDERFQITLSGAVGAPITDSVGSGVIVNDDAPAGPLSAACNIASLIAAINTANLDQLADTINLAANCSYTISSADNTTSDGANGLPIITSDMTIVGNKATIAVNNPVTSTRIFYVDSDKHLTLQNMTLADGKGEGGAVWSMGSLTIISSTLRNHNHSAIRTIAGSDTLIIDQSSFIDNRGAENGGAIHTHGVVTITRSLFLNNQATNGGAIFASSGAVMAIGNSTFSGNSIVNNGEGAALAVIRDFNNRPTVTIFNSTLVGNTAFGGSILDGIGGTVKVGNSIIANNSSSITCFGTSSDGNNLSSDNDCDGNNGDIKETNPVLTPLGNYGGATQSYLPTASSPAINAGNTVRCLSAPVNGLDQRGVVRPQGAGCEIGAVENKVVVSPATLGTGTRSLVYPTTQFSASGGTSPYSYVFTGTLPTGLTFTGNTLSGTPTQVGTFSFCVIATDKDGIAGASCPTLQIGELPEFSIGDVSVKEGNSGTQSAVFSVTLSISGLSTVSVQYATSNGTASAGSDYVSNNGTLSFAPGITSLPITVTTNGDTSKEPDETFFVTLSNAVGGVITDSQAIGIILNDEPVTPYNVGCGDSAALIVAISAANGDQQSDTINLQPCIYPLTAVNNNVEGNNGLPAITSDLTIIGNGAIITVNNPITLTRIFQIGSGDSLTLTNITLEGGTGEGSAIHNHGFLNVSKGTFLDNSQSSVGTIYSDGTLIVDQSSFANNSAGNGGAIFAGGVVTITRSLFHNNQATYGGAIFANSGVRMQIGNSTFSGNVAGNSGGGALVTSGQDVLNGATVSIANSTFVANSSFVGSAIREYFGTITIRNSIFANNIGSITCLGGTSAGNNISSDDDCGGTNSDKTNVDVKVAKLADYGGPTFTHALMAGSPAIDAGEPVTCLTAPVGGVDQRGLARPQGSACDAGAVEASVVVNPTSLNPVLQGSSFPNTQFVATGGTAPYSYAITGTLPSGMNFVNGTLSGIPNEAGDFPICVIAKGNDGMGGASCVTIVVNSAPQLSIADASVSEGNSGSLNLLLNVTLDVTSNSIITVKYATSDGSAAAGSDYSSSSGTLTFAAGVSNQTISVPINGDTTVESDETFTVTLSEPSNAAIKDGEATATILNDDVEEQGESLYLPLVMR
ncbi:MAG: choice-of-anchor Q domain-containing protein [Caldilineaceae bacterium]